MTTAPIPDPYAILGVTPDATDDDLDHAFRSVVRQLHPDTRTQSEPDAAADQRLQELLTAYASLRDPIRRAAYDRVRARPAINSGVPTPSSRVPAAPQTPRSIRVGPALRVGPVRWEPPASAVSDGGEGWRETDER
jgi:curved DNA-binding protein CbpA